ncbi:MAG: transposase family protein, partial [Bacteroidales bacterium]|nr:transposase family protein [Bacteroidales bacterium]
MPNYHNNIFCITPAKLAECGISKGYINRALAAQRKGEVYCWEHHKQGRQVYIHYYPLTDKYKALIKAVHCSGIEPELWRKQQDSKEAQDSIDSLVDQVTYMVTSNAEEIELLTNTKQYTHTEVHQLARAAGWLRLINDFDVKKARKLGFESIREFRGEVFKRCLNEQTATPPLIRFKKGHITSENRFYRNALNYKKEGIQALIHKGIGNVNREKKDTIMHAKLITLASAPVKYSWEDVAMRFNDWALENDKEQLTVSSIKQYLNTPKIKKVWYYARHGKLAADNELQPFINRDLPSFPDALWSNDGTTMQLYYLDDDGNVKSDLYVYFITDAHTQASIGHSIAFHENAEMVENALRNAIYIHKNKPYQMQYDNSSANKAKAIQNLKNNMSRVHFPCE